MTSSPKILGTAMLACALAFPFTAAFTTAAQTPPTQPPAPVPAVLQNYKPVTAERLKNPEDSDWLMVRRTYNGWGYSPLFQITTANVQRLQPVWVLATGVNNGHEAVPIVNNGIMFVATPGNQVIAINVRPARFSCAYQSKLLKTGFYSTRRAAAWRSTATRSFSHRAMRFWWHWRRRRAKKCGPRKSPRTRMDTT